MGRGLKFPLQVDPKTGKIAMSSHEDDILEAIGIIIGTYKGERVMRPDFGSNVADFAFTSTGHTFIDSISYEVKEHLVMQEPRIRDVEINCSDYGSSSGRLVLDVSYTVRTTNNRYNMVYPFFEGQMTVDV